MIKTYVIDTSVIIQSPDALTRFQDNVVVVPFVVLEKLGSSVSSHQRAGYQCPKGNPNA